VKAGHQPPENPTLPTYPDAAAPDPYAGLFPPAEPGEDEDIATLNETYIVPARKPTPAPAAEPAQDKELPSQPDQPGLPVPENQHTMLEEEPQAAKNDEGVQADSEKDDKKGHHENIDDKETGTQPPPDALPT